MLPILTMQLNSDPTSRPSLALTHTPSYWSLSLLEPSTAGSSDQFDHKMIIKLDALGCPCSPMFVLARAPWRFGALKFDVKHLQALNKAGSCPDQYYGENAYACRCISSFAYEFLS